MNQKTVMRAVFYKKHKTRSGTKQSLWNDFHEKYVIQKLPNCTALIEEHQREINSRRKEERKELALLKKQSGK